MSLAEPPSSPTDSLRARAPRRVAHLTAMWRGNSVTLNPHELHAMAGWYGAQECGNWDFEAMWRDLGRSLIHSEWRGRGDGESLNKQWETAVFSPRRNLLIVVSFVARYLIRVVVWSDSSETTEQNFVRLRESYLRPALRASDDGTAPFQVITFSHGEPDTRSFTVKPELKDPDDLALHFGAEFMTWHDNFVAQLHSSRRGVAVLQGPPGTGKTSYLRYLVRQLRQTHSFYYLLPRAYGMLGAASCVDFWVEQSCRPLSKVVMIEDAEGLLLERASDNRESVASLLGIGDGFLSDMLALVVVCTINSPIARIDPAIMRPGRLVATRQFRRLTKAEAELLARAKNISLNQEQDSFSLAEIYHGTAGLRQSCTGPAGFSYPPSDNAE